MNKVKVLTILLITMFLISTALAYETDDRKVDPNTRNTQEEKTNENDYEVEKRGAAELIQKEESTSGDYVSGEITCIDTDNKNYFTQGLVTYRNREFKDECKNPNFFEKFFLSREYNLIEYSCENENFEKERYLCEQGCSNGACIEETNIEETTLADNNCGTFDFSTSGMQISHPDLVGVQSEITIQVLGIPKGFDKEVYVSVIDVLGNEISKVMIEPDVSGELVSSAMTFNQTIETKGVHKLVSCDKEIGSFEVLEMSCKPLFSTNNNQEADRINILMIGIDYETQFKSIAQDLLSIDGNPTYYPGVSRGGEPVTGRMEWGLFSVEPFKSNLDKFNMWYLDTQINQATADYLALNSKGFFKFCNLNYLVPTIIRKDSPLNEDPIFASRASLPNFREVIEINKNMIEKFGTSLSTIGPDSRGTLDKSVYIHELLHATFGLRDAKIGSSLSGESFRIIVGTR